MKFIPLFLFLLYSCGQLGKGQKYERRNLSEYYVGSGIIQYYLPSLPKWANFSSSGKCNRSSTIRFFNYDKLRQSFKLSYQQAVQFQYMFNKDSEALKRKVKLGYLLFKDEEQVFFDTSDKVQAGFMAFRPPKFKRVHLVWIDHFLGDSKKLKSLKNSKMLNEGHPVFISLCKNFYELNKVLLENGLTGENIRLIPSEMFSPYARSGEKGHAFILEISELFKKDQKLILYLPKGEIQPFEINGVFEKKFY